MNLHKYSENTLPLDLVSHGAELEVHEGEVYTKYVLKNRYHNYRSYCYETNGSMELKLKSLITAYRTDFYEDFYSLRTKDIYEPTNVDRR